VQDVESAKNEDLFFSSWSRLWAQALPQKKLQVDMMTFDQYVFQLLHLCLFLDQNVMSCQFLLGRIATNMFSHHILALQGICPVCCARGQADSIQAWKLYRLAWPAVRLSKQGVFCTGEKCASLNRR